MSEFDDDEAVEPTRYCYIDDCHQKASLVIPSYPDTIRLCADHAHLHTPEPWEKR